MTGTDRQLKQPIYLVTFVEGGVIATVSVYGPARLDATVVAVAGAQDTRLTA